MGTVEAKVEALAEKTAAARAPGERSVGEDGARAESGLGEGKSEDGVRVSVNGKERLGGGEAAGVAKQGGEAREVPGDGVVGDGDNDVSGGRNGGLEDFEMNGVSSLLKMRGSGRVVDIEDGSLASSVGVHEDAVGVKSTLSKPAVAGGDASGAPDGGGKKLAVEENGETLAEIGKINEPTTEPADGEGEDVGECLYSVGDLVWGKVKSHPWWPGQIYDPLDASGYAAKLRTKGKLLVSYFGDGTFAWCHPTQLKPFEENFKVMMKQSTSKNFVNAVEAAVDQIGRFVNMRMTCSCVPIEKRLTRPLVGNSGIKEGVFVSDDGIGKLSVVQTEPRKLLSHLKFMTHLASTSSILELTVLKNWLLAFYSAKGFDQLPSYHEAVEIPGLEDLREDVEMVDGKVGIPFQGPVLEEWLTSPTGKAVLQKCHGASTNGGYKKPKQKSIAEIIGGNLDSQADVNLGNKFKEGAGSSVKEKKVNVDEAGIDDSKKEPLAFKRSNSSVEVDGGISGSRKEETKKSGRKRKRISSPEISGPQDKELSKHSVITEGEVKESSNTAASDGDSEQLEKGLLSRERKKSKYLSPPYMNINRVQKKDDIEAESLKISSLVRIGERMTKAADNLKGSTSSLKSKHGKDQEKDAEESGTGHKTFGEKIPESQGEGDNKIIELTKIKASANDVLSEVRAVAVDPVHAKESKSDVVEEFFPIYRSSVYRNGSNYKTFNKCQPGRKRKSQETEPKSLKGAPTDRSETSGKSAPSKPGRKKIKKDESKMDTPKSQPASKRSSGKKKEIPGRLLVTFSPGAALPTKDDLIKIYGKFGVLNETETDMCYNNLYALVVFQKNSNAEEALKSSQKENPFGSANASFELQCDSATPKRDGHSGGANAEDSPLPKQHSIMTPKKQSSSPSSTGDVSELQYVKLKLEKMTSMVDKSDGKLSKKMRSSLEGEIKDLLEKVSSSGRS